MVLPWRTYCVVACILVQKPVVMLSGQILPLSPSFQPLWKVTCKATFLPSVLIRLIFHLTHQGVWHHVRSFWPHWVFVAAHGFSHAWSADPRARGLISCSTRAELPRGSWELRLLTRNWTHVSCLGSRFPSTRLPGKSHDITLWLDLGCWILTPDNLLMGLPLLADAVLFAQLCLTLCDPMDYTVHGILQARILEWVAFPFSRGSSQSRDWTQVSPIAGGFFTSWVTR